MTTDRLPFPARHDSPTSVAAALGPIRTGKRRTDLMAVLARLVDGPATTAELAAISHRFGARIRDLRVMGHNIETSVRVNGNATYRLVPTEAA